MDAKLVLKEIQNQNSFVFKRLFEENYEELVNYAHNYLYDKDRSEDVVQEVFIHLWERSSEIDLKSSLKGYLYAMVRNRCLNVLKAIKITDDAKMIDLQSLVSSSYEFDAFSDEDLNILHHRLLKIVERLPSKMQKIVKLRFIDNYKYADIAEEMDISINTVKTQLKRAKSKITQEMAFIFVLLISEL